MHYFKSPIMQLNRTECKVSLNEIKSYWHSKTAMPWTCSILHIYYAYSPHKLTPLLAHCSVNKVRELKTTVFWVVAPCSLAEVYRRFRGACSRHHQSIAYHSKNFQVSGKKVWYILQKNELLCLLNIQLSGVWSYCKVSSIQSTEYVFGITSLYTGLCVHVHIYIYIYAGYI
jgi:hypothetical protein